MNKSSFYEKLHKQATEQQVQSPSTMSLLGAGNLTISAGAACGQLGPADVCKERRREIPDEIAGLFLRSEMVKDAIERLAQKIQPVMKPCNLENPDPSPSKAGRPPAATSTGEILGQLNQRLQWCVDALAAMDFSIEL